MFALVLCSLWADEKWEVQPACCSRYIGSFLCRADKNCMFSQTKRLFRKNKTNLKKKSIFPSSPRNSWIPNWLTMKIYNMAITRMEGKDTYFVEDALSPKSLSQCRPWNRFLPTYWQTYTHLSQPQCLHTHCFGYSWPLCFTYQSLSAACWAPPHLPSSFSYRWAKPSISLLQAAFVITPTRLLFARYPKSSKSTWVACAWMLVFSNAKEEQHFLFLLQVTLKSLTSTDCMAYIPHEIREL